jgi:RNA ligase-like protein
VSSSKYPRSYHAPFSEGATNDDKIAKSVDRLIGVPIVITEKMDGSCTCMERDIIYARSHNGPPKHPSFDVVKAMHAKIKQGIPEGMQFFGENLLAVHSIKYTALPSYFLLFNIRIMEQGKSYWLSWDLVEYNSEQLDLHTVPILFRGTVKSEKELWELTSHLMKEPSCCGGEREGVVIRVADGFVDEEFSECLIKIVRAGHVGSNDEHWMHREIEKNLLKGE